MSDCATKPPAFFLVGTPVNFTFSSPCPFVSGVVTKDEVVPPVAGRYQIIIVIRDAVLGDATVSFQADANPLTKFNITNTTTIGNITPEYITSVNKLIVNVETLKISTEGFFIRFEFSSALDNVTISIRAKDSVELTQGVGSIPFICGEEFILNIRADTNPTTGEVVCVMFDVLDCKYHPCGFGKYEGTSIRVDNGTRIWILNLKVNKVIRGTGTPKMKFKELGVNGTQLIGYILVKIIMGRILFGEIEICWALTKNYQRLIRTISKSSVYDKILPFLLENSNLEQYLR